MDTETHELIAGYALDALDPDDEARVRELLATSEEAREELRALSEVAAAMATATVGPELRAPSCAAGSSTRLARSRRPWSRSRSTAAPGWFPSSAAVAAIAAVAALALGIWGGGAPRTS